MKKLFILPLALALALIVGCVTSGPVKTEQILTPLKTLYFEVLRE